MLYLQRNPIIVGPIYNVCMIFCLFCTNYFYDNVMPCCCSDKVKRTYKKMIQNENEIQCEPDFLNMALDR